MGRRREMKAEDGCFGYSVNQLGGTYCIGLIERAKQVLVAARLFEMCLSVYLSTRLKVIFIPHMRR